MVFEEQRVIHEDLERLEQGIADRMGEEPINVCCHVSQPPPASLINLTDIIQIRDRLNRDHEVLQLLEEIQKQSMALLSLYQDKSSARTDELLQISTGDPFEEFNRQINEIKEHHT